MRAESTWAVAIALAIGLGGCSEQPDALPAPPPVVGLTMREFAIDPAPSKLSAGRVVMRMRNTGQVAHRILVVPLSKDFPPIIEHLRGPNRRFVEPLATSSSIGPKRTRSLAVDLEPGRYAVICPLTKPDNGEAHARLGMATELLVR